MYKSHQHKHPNIPCTLRCARMDYQDQLRLGGTMWGYSAIWSWSWNSLCGCPFQDNVSCLWRPYFHRWIILGGHLRIQPGHHHEWIPVGAVVLLIASTISMMESLPASARNNIISKCVLSTVIWSTDFVSIWCLVWLDTAGDPILSLALFEHAPCL